MEEKPIDPDINDKSDGDTKPKLLRIVQGLDILLGQRLIIQRPILTIVRMAPTLASQDKRRTTTHDICVRTSAPTTATWRRAGMLESTSGWSPNVRHISLGIIYRRPC